MLDEILHKAIAGENTAIEFAMDLKSVVVSNDSLIKLIKNLYGFYAPLEKKLTEFEMPLHKLKINLRERHKLKLLAHDLTILGLKEVDIQQIKTCPCIPEIENGNDALAVIYLMEVWSKKNQTIHQLILSKSSFAKKDQLKYHAGYGDLTEVMWSDLIKSMNMVPEDQRDLVSRKTVEMLKVLKEWLIFNK